MRAYPSLDLDRPTLLKSKLGTFWSEAYADQAELDATLAGLAIPWRQAAMDLDELAAAACYETIPVLHTREWTTITLSEAESRSARYSGLRYDPGSTAAFGSAGRFGDADPSAPVAAPLGGIVDVPLIFDAPYNPGVALALGADYAIDAGRGALLLAADPFADPRWTPAPVYDSDGVQVDRLLTLWAWRARFDRSTVYRRIGYAMGVHAPSTAAGLDFVNGVVDAVATGTSDFALRRLFSALCDVPICRGESETVEAVFRDDDGLAIVTDATVYRCAAGAAPVVSAGDVLRLGDCPVDALRFDALNAGEVPDDLPYLAVGPGLLADSVRGAVAFLNADSPVRARDLLDADGAPLPCRISWDLGGSPRDAAAFWEAVRAGEARDGVALSQLLDRREAPSGPPTAADVPAAINGLRFLLENVLRGSVLLVRIKVEGCGPGRLDAALMQSLRRLTPPHLVVLVQVQTPPLASGVGPGPQPPLPAPTLVLSDVASPSPAPPPSDDLSASAAPEYTP